MKRRKTVGEMKACRGEYLMKGDRESEQLQIIYQWNCLGETARGIHSYISVWLCRSVVLWRRSLWCRRWYESSSPYSYHISLLSLSLLSPPSSSSSSSPSSSTSLSSHSYMDSLSFTFFAFIFPPYLGPPVIRLPSTSFSLTLPPTQPIYLIM